MRTATRSIPLIAATAAAFLLLTGCAGAAEETTTREPVVEETQAEVEEAPATPGGQPAWANPVTTPGELLTTIEAGDVSVEVYQVGTVASPKDGFFANPDTNLPIIAAGDALVFVNFVITNNGDTIDLGSSLVDVDPKYDDWPYIQGMDTITGADLFAAQEINPFGTTTFEEPGIYPLGSGESFSYGTNFKYQAGSPITFSVKYIPVDAAGELLHDEGVEGQGASTIK